ncbi:MAG TPA: hypothetical protein VFW63_02840 [Acidimicrobiales bacterium]|nr:hypothetical protein [Acidimicrobiales bacterium]
MPIVPGGAMPDPTNDPTPDPEEPELPPRAPGETDIERAEEVYEEVGADNPDPTTRREAVELELEDEGLSPEGEELGEHIE